MIFLYGLHDVSGPGEVCIWFLVSGNVVWMAWHVSTNCGCASLLFEAWCSVLV